MCRWIRVNGERMLHLRAVTYIRQVTPGVDEYSDNIWTTFSAKYKIFILNGCIDIIIAKNIISEPYLYTINYELLKCGNTWCRWILRQYLDNFLNKIQNLCIQWMYRCGNGKECCISEQLHIYLWIMDIMHIKELNRQYNIIICIWVLPWLLALLQLHHNSIG